MRILSLSEFIPEQICDIIRFTQYHGDRNINHYCGYISDFISQVRYDDSIDGCVFPRSCDSTRIMNRYLSGVDKFVYQILVPARQDNLAINFFAKGIADYQKAIEGYYQQRIDTIEQRIEYINTRNKAIERLYSLLGDISYFGYISAIHDILKKPLFEQKIENCHMASNHGGKKVYLIGSFLSNLAIIDLIEKSGMLIVGDNLPESGRIKSNKDYKQEDDIYEYIAECILKRRTSPTQNNFKSILQSDLDENKEKNAKGVIFVIQKYCEPYLYLFSVYKKMLEANNIPSVVITVSHSDDMGRAEMILETFADTI